VNRKRIKSTFLFFLIAIIILSGCKGNSTEIVEGSNSNTGEKVLNIALNGEANKLDPHFASPVTEVSVVQSMFNGLVRFPTGTVNFDEIEGDLAEKWETNEDATQWTFYLQKGVQWHKGYGELTSEDVKWSFERVMDEKTGSPWKGDYKNVVSIEAPDPYKIVFKLNEPDASFLLKVLNYHGGMIVNKKAIEDAGDQYMTSPVGTGPFMFEEYKAKDRAVLVKNPDYFRGEPKLDKLVFKIMTDPTAVEIALDKGEIQLAAGLNDQLWIDQKKQNENLILEYTSPPLLWGIYLNTSKPPLDDIRVRQAIAHAIDIEPLINDVLGKDAAKIPASPVPTGYFGRSEVGHYEFDPDKAKELLKEAGYENGLTLPKQYISTLASYLDKMLYIQDQLRNVGIEMPLEQVDHSTYHENARNDLNNVILYGYVRSPHADSTLTQFFYGPSTVGKSTAVTNYSHYENIDDLIEQGRVELDLEKAKDIYKTAQEQIKKDYVFVPIAESETVLVRRKEVELGYNSNQIEGTMIYFYYVDENTDIKN